MSTVSTYLLGSHHVNRMGYGAMQLAGPNAFGPPRDHEGAVQVLREAVALGVDHIDTSDYYGPHLTNEIIAEALYPYPDDLVIVTKVGARRNADGGWVSASSPEELVQAVEDNLQRLKLDVLEIVNFRAMFNMIAPKEGSIAAQIEALADLKSRGSVRHIGVSNVTPSQVSEAQAITEIACVQNMYNIAHRQDDALIDQLMHQGVAYVPFFPLGGFSPVQSRALSDIAAQLEASEMQVALAWLLRRSPNILLIPGTSSLAHLRENLAAKQVELTDSMIADLNAI